MVASASGSDRSLCPPPPQRATCRILAPAGLQPDSAASPPWVFPRMNCMLERSACACPRSFWHGGAIPWPLPPALTALAALVQVQAHWRQHSPERFAQHCTRGPLCRRTSIDTLCVSGISRRRRCRTLCQLCSSQLGPLSKRAPAAVFWGECLPSQAVTVVPPQPARHWCSLLLHARRLGGPCNPAVAGLTPALCLRAAACLWCLPW